MGMELAKEFDAAREKVHGMKTHKGYQHFATCSETKSLFLEIEEQCIKWESFASYYCHKVSSTGLLPLINCMDRLWRMVADYKEDERSIPSEMKDAYDNFKRNLPVLAFEIAELKGLFQPEALNAPVQISLWESQLESKKQAIVEGIEKDVKQSVKIAYEEVEQLKKEARTISVDTAKKQFDNAAGQMRWKLIICGCAVVGTGGLLLWCLYDMLKFPPPVVQSIVDALVQQKEFSSKVPLPMVLLAGAYYTSIRVALISAITLALTFSLRMFRAYLHMIELNHHKQRIIESIGTFVAAVYEDSRKDFIVTKLVDCVAEFGDSGILNKTSDSPNIPSIAIDALSKNIGKAE